MSWKTNTIVVRPSLLGADPDELLRHLGYEKRRKSKEVFFGGGIGGASIWIGTIDDRILMYTYLADQFFDGFCDGAPDRDFTFLKSALFRHFPEASIVALYLDSRVGAWGFAIFRGGTLVRRFYGHDGTILGDEGSQLPEENAYLANCDRLEVDGDVLYKDRSAPGEEPLSLAEHGEGLFCEVWRSVTGYEFDAPGLLQIPGSEFWLNDDEEKFRLISGKNEYHTRPGRPWWKFWG
jgi:hypothetical protein